MNFFQRNKVEIERDDKIKMAVQLIGVFGGGLFKESIKRYPVGWAAVKMRVRCIVKDILNFVHAAVAFNKITDDKVLMLRYQPHENLDKSHVISLFANVFLRGGITAISIFYREIQMKDNMVQGYHNDC